MYAGVDESRARGRGGGETGEEGGALSSAADREECDEGRVGCMDGGGEVEKQWSLSLVYMESEGIVVWSDKSVEDMSVKLGFDGGGVNVRPFRVIHPFDGNARRR